GRADFKEPLPKGLRYGCVAEVQYADGPPSSGAVHVATHFFRVDPLERTVTVTSKHPATVEPGGKVVLDLQADRAGQVDLFVPVYDKALLSIKPEVGPDLRSFYLADDRVRHTLGRDLLTRQLQGVTVASLLARAKKMVLGYDPNSAEAAELLQLLTDI